MFFVLSKTFWFFAQPSSLIAAAIIVGLLLARRPAWCNVGNRLAWSGLALLLFAGLGPLSNMVVLPLEQRFPARHGHLPAGPIAGIIVLGGYEDGRTTEARGTLTLNEAAERITETAVVAHRMPGVPVIISGGSGAILLEDKAAATAIGDFLQSIGIAASRIRLEDKSKTTYENAMFTRALIQPKPGDRWILITSAAHMPRSVGAFRHQGFDVIPWPADFRTKDAGDAIRPFGSLPMGLKRLDEATMEWVGLVAYRMLGRTSAVFPAP